VVVVGATIYDWHLGLGVAALIGICAASLWAGRSEREINAPGALNLARSRAPRGMELGREIGFHAHLFFLGAVGLGLLLLLAHAGMAQARDSLKVQP
jgi:hypothetical protein